ncbi:MAG: hypothetical protein LBJ25_04765 [Candidatus Margulisbacteria bacterium]|nr:hypothetical protein [Candidatus Margulisiibacteriota bacterium]
MVTDNYTDKFEGTPYFIKKGEQLSAAGMTAALNTREKVANKVTGLSGASTDDEYPSAKAVHDALNGSGNDVVHKSENETITGVKTFGATAEPKLGAAKITDAANDGTKFATEAQVYKAVQGMDILPRGTILAMAVASWLNADAAFQSKWRVCDGSGGTPNLTGRFLRGGTASDPLTGDGKKILSINEIPSHSHRHTHDTHTGRVRFYDAIISPPTNVNPPDSPAHDVSGVFGSEYSSYMMNSSGKGVASITNCHPILTLNAGHSYDQTATGGGQAFDVVPAFYTVIYIMKIS